MLSPFLEDLLDFFSNRKVWRFCPSSYIYPMGDLLIFNVPDEQPVSSAEIFDLNARHWIEATNMLTSLSSAKMEFFLRFANNIVERFVEC